jgi:hypothetical protein
VATAAVVTTVQAQSSSDVAASDLPGNGSESNPYEISNASELQAMEDDLDENYELVSDINASNTSGFNDGRGFDPVGEGIVSSERFTGSFNGSNHTITGLTIDRPDESDIGLFGSTDEATISNVALVNVTVAGDENVGGLVGNKFNGTVQNATTSGNVTGNQNVGGLVGIQFLGSIQNTTTSGNVTANNELSRAGGLVGFNDGGDITRVKTSVNVVGVFQVGGITGQNDELGIITDATASGDVTGDADVGGLVGTNDGNITTATTSGDVTGNNFVGGLVGTNDGNITTATTSGDVTGNNSVGGLVGTNDGTITGVVENSNSTRM